MTKLQNRGAWQFYSGLDSRNRPRWNRDVSQKKPVLTDQRRLYGHTFGTNISNLSVISQGGVTYLPGLKRYIYTSWTEYTFEFYESPTPWGPWKHFVSRDFSGYPWSSSKHGGYGTTVPSKFVSPDGRTMWVQANVCPCGGGGNVYHYSLRKMVLTPADPAPASNDPAASVNLATTGTPISKSSASGSLTTLNDGTMSVSQNDYDDEVKTASWWGYTWPKRHKVNRVEFTSGTVTGQGGWFTGRPRVQVRRDGACGLGFARTGANNGWIRTSGTGWSALTQEVPVTPGRTYTFAGWFRSSGSLPDSAGKFGVRVGDRVLAEQAFGATADYVQRQVTVTVPEGVGKVTVSGGFVAPGTDTWIQLDDLTVAE